MLGLLSLIRKPWLLIAVGIAGAFTVGFWRGHEAGSDAAKVASLEAQIAAERAHNRRLKRIRSDQENRIADLQNALDSINDEDSLTGGGSDCRLDPDFMRQLAARYGIKRSDSTVSGVD